MTSPTLYLRYVYPTHQASTTSHSPTAHARNLDDSDWRSGDDCDGHVLDYAEMLADRRGRVSVDIDPALPAARDLASSQGCRQERKTKEVTR